MSRPAVVPPLAHDSGTDPLDAIAEEFAHCLRRGERVDPEVFAARVPARAGELREILAAVQVLEDAARASPGRDRTRALDRPPARIGEFELLRELGRGGMGIVYEAIQHPLGRRVALKLLAPGMASTPAHRARFVREAKAASRLHHTHIVPVFGVGHASGYDYYAMQHIEGSSLAATKVEGWRAATEIVHHVARALEHAHARGVLHRDVKPSNILLDREGQPWLADFGLAKLEGASGITGPGAVLGTVSYLAPECLDGRADVRTDVYALGVTLYELVAGARPFAGDHAFAVIEAIRAHQPRRARDVAPAIPRDLDTVIHTAMAREPDARYATAGALARDLARVLDDVPIAARRIGALERAWRLARAHRAVASLASALVLTLVAAAGSGWYLYHGERAAVARADAHAAAEAAQALTAARAASEAQAAHAVAERNLALSLDALGGLFEAIASDQAKAGLRPEHPDPRRDPNDRGPPGRGSGRDPDGRGSEGRDEPGPDGRAATTAREVELVVRILAFYERFAATNDASGSLALRRDLVLAHCRMGALHRRLDRPLEARAAYGRAVALAEDLVRAHPTDAACRLQLARGLAGLAALAADAEAIVLLGRAQEIALALALEAPGDEPLTAERAAWHIDLARAYERAGHHERGVAERRRAIALWGSLGSDTPDLPYSLFIASTLRAIAHQELEAHVPARAIEDLESAREAVARARAAYDTSSPHAGRARELESELADVLVRAYELVGRHADADRVRREAGPRRR